MRFRVLLLLVLIAGSLAGPRPAVAETTSAFALLNRFPEAGKPLAIRENLYLQISYDLPAGGEMTARAVDGTGRMVGIAGPGTRVAPGKGWFVTWISSFGAMDADTIEVLVHPGAGEPPRIVARLPVRADWSQAAEPAADRPPWLATHLGTDRTAEAAKGDALDARARWLAIVLFWSVPIYLAAQFVLLRVYHGAWRVAAGLPLVVTVPLVALILLAGLFRGEAGLLPLAVLFVSAPLLAYLLLVALAKFAWEDLRRPQRA